MLAVCKVANAEMLPHYLTTSPRTHMSTACPAALLPENQSQMDPAQLWKVLELLHAYGNESQAAPVASVGRVLVQLAKLDGPLKLTAQPTVGDPDTFLQHLLALSSQLNTLHEPELLGTYRQSPNFQRSKFELFALQHMQLLVKLQRVQTAVKDNAYSKHGPELHAFMNRMGWAARVMVFQPALQHALLVMQTVSALPKQPVQGSMWLAMQRPADAATDADCVEWLQLNLLLQFQNVYKTAVCDQTIYQGPQYSLGEASLFVGFLRLEEIYTHLIGRFPSCCPLNEQQHAVLTDLCQKLNKYFTDGKQIKQLLEESPHGKVQLKGHLNLPSVQFAVRDFFLPFMITFTDLLKEMWELWSTQRRQRRSLEGVARLVGSCLAKQLTEQAAVMVAPKIPLPDALSFGGGSGSGGSRYFNLEVYEEEEPQSANAMNGFIDSTPEGPSGWASVVARPATDMPTSPASVPAITPITPSASPPIIKRLASAGAGAPAAKGTEVEDQVQLLVAQREQSRAARDFESADRLREQLSRLGVSLDDQNKVWRSADGRTGQITAVNISELHAQKAAKSGAATLSDDEIDKLVKEREQARFTNDYKTADSLRETLEKHGVHLDTTKNKWQASDGRSVPIGPVNISAAHAQKAARSGAPKMPIEEIERILVQREQARACRDYKMADVLRDTLEKHGVYLDAKEKKWHASDGCSGAIVVTTLSNEEIGRVLANRQAARLRHDFKTADRLRDQLNEQGLSVDDKHNRWEIADGRSGSIDPFTSDFAQSVLNGEAPLVAQPPPPHAKPFAAPAPAPAAASSSDGDNYVDSGVSPSSDKSTAMANGAMEALTVKVGEWQGAATSKSERRRGMTEKERRELAKQLRTTTGASARLCEKALQSHADDMDRAANWLLDHGEQRGEGRRRDGALYSMPELGAGEPAVDATQPLGQEQGAMAAGEASGLCIDQWQATDARTGITKPFAVESAALSSKDGLHLPPPRASLAPVSLASVMEEQATGKFPSATSSTGMLNPRGEYNFLNVIVQTLWHVEAFRKSLMSAATDDPIVAALRALFEELTASHAASDGATRAPISPEALRILLSKDEHFKLADMADAAEAFETLLNRIKASGAEAAISVFEAMLIDASSLASKPQPQPCSAFVLYASVAALREVADRSKPFDEVLRLRLVAAGAAPLTPSATESRKISVGPLPPVFTFGLAWDSTQQSREALDAVLERIDETIDISKVLAGVDSPRPASLCGIVCYYAAHYIAMVHDPQMHSWLHFDDTSDVTLIGSSWVEVRSVCMSRRYLPALILYHKLAPDERGAPLSAEAASGSSWATMAVRCAAGGGISASTAAAGKIGIAGVPPLARGGGASRSPGIAAKTAEATAALARTRLTGSAPLTISTSTATTQTTSVESALVKRGPGACHNCDDPNHESRACPKPCREYGAGPGCLDSLERTCRLRPRLTESTDTRRTASGSGSTLFLALASSSTSLPWRCSTSLYAHHDMAGAARTSTALASTTALASRRPNVSIAKP